MHPKLDLEITTLRQLEAAALRVKDLIPPEGQLTIALTGDLGAGKTTFVGVLLKTLGLAEIVSSPTFVLEHRYQTPQGLEIEHWDVYRLSEPPLELLEPVSPKTVRFIEWADKFHTLWEASDYRCSFYFDPPTNVRRLKIY